jgi:hypothetical protein
LLLLLLLLLLLRHFLSTRLSCLHGARFLRVCQPGQVAAHSARVA